MSGDVCDVLRIIRHLNLPNIFERLLEGDVKPPNSLLTCPAGFYEFPPAYVPLFSDDGIPLAYGIWIHNPLNAVKYSFVSIDYEEGEVIECARNWEQFLWYLVFESRAISYPDPVDKELSEFLAVCPVAISMQFIEEQLRKEKDERSLVNISCFQTETPLLFFEDVQTDDCPSRQSLSVDNYSGDFPIKDNARTNPWSCIARAFVRNQVFFLETEQSELIQRVDEFVLNNQFNNAWSCLNSSGWSFDALFLAFKKFKEAVRSEAEDNLLECLWENWTEVRFSVDESKFQREGF